MEECAWVTSLNCSSSCSVEHADLNLSPLCIYAIVVDMLTAAWRVLNTILVLCMQPGFALLEAGACREVHREVVLSKNIMDMMFSPGLFALFIYGFNDALARVSGVIRGEEVFFHSLFCATAVTICSGAVAERMTVTAYLINAVVMSLVIYPVLATSAWTTEGTFSDLLSPNGHRYHDWAGSGVVHLTGAACAFQANLFMGPRSWYSKIFPDRRLGRFDTWVGDLLPGRYLGRKDSPPKGPEGGDTPEVRSKFQAARLAEFTATNVQKQITGTFILQVGWIAFNCGSLRMDSAGKDIVGSIALNTLLAGISAGSFGFVLIKFQAFRKDPMKSMPMGVICNSCITGLVAITAGCDVATPFQSFYLGVLAGCVYPAVTWALQVLGIDDPVNAIAVHGAGGILGLLFPGVVFRMDCDLLKQHESVAEDELCLGRSGYSDGKQLVAQLVGILLIVFWASLISALVWLGLTMLECARALQLDTWSKEMDEVIKGLRGGEEGTTTEVEASEFKQVCGARFAREQVLDGLKSLIESLKKSKGSGSWRLDDLEHELSNFWEEHDFATECAAWHWRCCQCRKFIKGSRPTDDPRPTEGKRPFECLSRCLCLHRIPPSVIIFLPRLRISPSKERDGLETFLGDGLLPSCKNQLNIFHDVMKQTHTIDERLKEARIWVIIGASAEGLALALLLAFKAKQLVEGNPIDKPNICIFDWRLSRSDPATPELRFETDDRSSPRRQDQVVLLHEDFLSRMEQEPVWADEKWKIAFKGERVWPGRQSLLRWKLEEALLERAQARDMAPFIDVRRLPEEVCRAMQPALRNKESSADVFKKWLQSLPTQPSVLVAADGCSSLVRRSHGEHFVWKELGKDYVLSVSQQDPSILQQQEWNVVLSLAQQRYFFNACQRKGELFIRLTEGEFDALCTQKGASRDQPPAEPVLLSELTAASWLAPAVGDGKRLFGITKDSRDVVLQKIALGCANRHYCRTPGDGRFVCLIGDAALQQHPWPGLGFQAGLHAAFLLAESWQGCAAKNFDQGLETFDRRMCAMRDEAKAVCEGWVKDEQGWLHGQGLAPTSATSATGAPSDPSAASATSAPSATSATSAAEPGLTEDPARAFKNNVNAWVGYCLGETEWRTQRSDLDAGTMSTELDTRIVTQLERLSKEALRHFQAAARSSSESGTASRPLRTGWPLQPLVSDWVGTGQAGPGRSSQPDGRLETMRYWSL